MRRRFKAKSLRTKLLSLLFHKSTYDSLMDLTINGTYKLLDKVGGGSFGDVYIAKNIVTQELFAVKIETNYVDCDGQLHREYDAYKEFDGPQAYYFPQPKYYGVEGRYNCLVMDLMGPSLENVFHLCRRKFSLKTIVQLGEQMLSRIEFIHKKGWLHRDIKPDNFCMGLGKKEHICFAVDYGLVKRFKDPVTRRHISFRDGKNLVGTARYASLHSHKGYELSRRDDLESLGYCLVYFFKGKLPWQGIQAETNEEKYHKIYKFKKKTSIEKLCEGMPEQFVHYFQYVRSLDFKDKPDYPKLHGLFEKVMKDHKWETDNKFEWLGKASYLSSIKARLPPTKEPVNPVATPALKPTLNFASGKAQPKKRPTKSQKKRQALAEGKPIRLKPNKYIPKAMRARLGITQKTIPREEFKKLCV
ncbi:kinase-like domain-containing protein [Zychaea mexicana]|uniref:kinase-like domain-containing protein n=1 Tax=Zychaea mexicana TaxID=64656 RepID=UPI0022FF3D9D|nr:kinase-like domain-containing protein [Zychaea mexicana]KAI9489672.1 kinase-like domain-containing protein [Zychaea mexicana]